MHFREATSAAMVDRADPEDVYLGINITDEKKGEKYGRLANR